MQGPGAPHFACTGCFGLYGGRLVRLWRGGSSIRFPGFAVPGCRCQSIGEVFRVLSGVPLRPDGGLWDAAPQTPLLDGWVFRPRAISPWTAVPTGLPLRFGCCPGAVSAGLLHPSDPFPDVRSEYTGCLSLCRLRLTSACKVGLWGCAASRSGFVSPASRARYAPVRCRCRRRAPRPAAPGAQPRRVRRRSGRPTARRAPARPV